MLLPFPLVSKPWEESLLEWSPGTPPSPLKNHRFSQQLPIIKLRWASESSKEKERWPMTINLWVSLIWMVFHLPLEVCLRLKSLSTSTPTASSTSEQRTRPLEETSPSPYNLQEDFLNRKSRIWLTKLKNIKTRTKREENLLTLKMRQTLLFSIQKKAWMSTELKLDNKTSRKSKNQFKN